MGSYFSFSSLPSNVFLVSNSLIFLFKIKTTNPPSQLALYSFFSGLVFPIELITVTTYIIFIHLVHLPTVKHKPDIKDFCLIGSLLHLQCLEQCQASS